jgi:NAD(P) transhydrogenase subunit beta
MITFLINGAYIIASISFILGIKMLSSPKTARRGNLISALGMLIAVVVTLLDKQIISYEWIIVGLIIGSSIGIIAARRVKMTGMPEMVALFNGFGGVASLLVGASIYYTLNPAATPWGILLSIYLAAIIGGITFTGSLVAYGKLSEKLPGKPITYRAQNFINIALILLLIIIGSIYAGYLFPSTMTSIFVVSIALSLALGLLITLPIGGADMPVMIALLNSYSGLAACASGFAILNNVLIVSGALVGASGIILTNIMCKAMNRSLSNVLFGSFAVATPKKSDTQAAGETKPITPEDTYLMLEAARSVLIIPGYGMAVAQAQHAVKELGELLETNGTEVKYVIHPVAGRMPGHMNVLLAEAGVPYEQLVEPEAVNSTMESVDICLIIGANDVVNPSARDDASSSLYGMPIIEADRAKIVTVFKRSMRPGFAGVQNPLFFKENTRMLFGDAKSSVSHLIGEFKS